MKGMIAICNINLQKRLSVFCEKLLFMSELLLNVLLCLLYEHVDTTF